MVMVKSLNQFHLGHIALLCGNCFFLLIHQPQPPPNMALYAKSPDSFGPITVTWQLEVKINNNKM